MRTVWYLLLSLLPIADLNAQGVTLTATPRFSPICVAEKCSDRDALVFVHGIYGSAETFTNKSTGYNWPERFPRFIRGRPVDVFVLEYRTQMVAWARQANPDLLAVSKEIATALKPLRKKEYRSIGFVAHSLGGNVVSTYIHMVKTSLGHPQRAQNAYVITLGTPVLGAQIADIAEVLKAGLGMSDPLLASLRANNLYLTMLQEFRQEEGRKGDRYGCRPVHLHAAYEMKSVALIKVVPELSGSKSVEDFVDSPVQGFQVNHLEISRPRDFDDPIARWTEDRINDEFTRLDEWDMFGRRGSDRLCEMMPMIRES